MKNFLLIGAGILAIAGSSCSSSRKSAGAEHKTLNTVVVSANNPYDLYRAAEPRYWDITHTTVALTFDLTERTASGSAWIKLHPYFYATDSLVLDAQSMQIDSVCLVEDGRKTPLRFDNQDDRLTVHFQRTYTRTEEPEIFIKYLAQPYATPAGGSRAITEDRGLYFINTRNEVPGKPVQIWTQGETQSNSHWMPTLDQPNERMTFQVELTVPDSFKTLSNGTLLRREVAGKDLRRDVWAIDQPIQPYAAMFAIGNFSVVEDQSWKGVKVNYYVEPEYAPYAKLMFRNTPEMIAHFSELTGVPYPWKKYGQVVVRDYVSGAMENTSASLFGEFVNQNAREIADRSNEDVVSHELFHQWFGDYVTAESWSNLTVNESFANYGEQLWRLYKYGRASKDELAYNDLSKYLNQSEYNDEPLVRFHYGNREEMFDRISYEKGGAVLNYLNGLLGDEAFAKAMNIYLTQNALQPAEAHHWRMAVEQASGKDWNWFFNQWYFRGGHPTLDLQYLYDDAKALMTVNVVQQTSDSGTSYVLPLKAALVYGNQVREIDWTVDKKRKSFTYSYQNGQRPVFLPDYRHWLVGVIKEKKSTADWLIQMNVSRDYVNKRRAVSSAMLALADSNAQQIITHALSDSLYAIRVHALQLLARLPEKNGLRKVYDRKVSELALLDPDHRVRAAAIDVVGAWKLTGMKTELEQALQDSSYMIAGAALEALGQFDRKEAYRAAKTIMQGDPKSDLQTVAWNMVAERGMSEDLSLFSSLADHKYGRMKIALADNLRIYALHTDDLEAAEKALLLIKKMAATESIKSYRLAIGSTVVGVYTEAKRKMKADDDNAALVHDKELAALAGKYLEEIMAAEPDPENLTRYKGMMSP